MQCGLRIGRINGLLCRHRPRAPQKMEIQIEAAAASLEKRHRPWLDLLPLDATFDSLVHVVLRNRGTNNRMAYTEFVVGSAWWGWGRGKLLQPSQDLGSSLQYRRSPPFDDPAEERTMRHTRRGTAWSIGLLAIGLGIMAVSGLPLQFATGRSPDL